ncbi:lactoylglutathione lyase [Viridibacterium curvum]|uniref:Lactoylglutathione lyase n=1 Tax=Viridibacterium curvum TaxID=1101404 RepID=A0ABP9QP26_9RHOO
MRILHTMIRVGDLERSLAFYTGLLGMRLMRREDYPDGRFTLAFVGYGDEQSAAVIELTHNWGVSSYEHGNAFGHIALSVADAKLSCEQLAAAGVTILRPPGPMNQSSPQRRSAEVIAFIADPDGHRIELVETGPTNQGA